MAERPDSDGQTSESGYVYHKNGPDAGKVVSFAVSGTVVGGLLKIMEIGARIEVCIRDEESAG